MINEISTLIILLCVQISLSAELVSLKDFLKTELSASAKVSKETFDLSADDKSKLAELAQNSEEKSFTFYYGKAADGKIEKSCTVVVQKGKEGPMSVGTCFNPNGLIESVTILGHEEERGKGISEQSFLKQFKSKKVSDAFVVGKDVDGISGATWSSNYVSEALRKSSFGFTKFVKGKK